MRPTLTLSDVMIIRAVFGNLSCIQTWRARTAAFFSSALGVIQSPLGVALNGFSSCGTAWACHAVVLHEVLPAFALQGVLICNFVVNFVCARVFPHCAGLQSCRVVQQCNTYKISRNNSGVKFVWRRLPCTAGSRLPSCDRAEHGLCVPSKCEDIATRASRGAECRARHVPKVKGL